MSELITTVKHTFQAAMDACKSACDSLMVPGALKAQQCVAQCRESISSLTRTAALLQERSTDGFAFNRVSDKTITPCGRVICTVRETTRDAAQHFFDGDQCKTKSLQYVDKAKRRSEQAHNWVLAAHAAILAGGLTNVVVGCRAYSQTSKRLATLNQLMEQKGAVGLNLEHLNQMFEALKLQFEALQRCLEKMRSVLDESPEVLNFTVQNFYKESELFNESADSLEEKVMKDLKLIQRLSARAAESNSQAQKAAMTSLVRAGGSAVLTGVSVAIAPSGTVASAGLRTAATAANALAVCAHGATVAVAVREWGICSSLLSTLQSWEREMAELAKDVDHLRGQAVQSKTEVQQLLHAKNSEWESNMRIIQEERDARMVAEAKAKAEADAMAKANDMEAEMEAMRAQMAKMKADMSAREAEMNLREAEMKVREAELKAADSMRSAVEALTEDFVIREFQKTANPKHTISRVEFLRDDPHIHDNYERRVRQTHDHWCQMNDRRSGPNKNIFSPPLPPGLPADDKADKDSLLAWLKSSASTAKLTGLNTSYANMLFVWHGAPMLAIDGISEDGFASLVRDDAPDPGWFGNGGHYTTPEAAYACKYASVYPQPKPTNAAGEWAVLLCIAVIGLAYPITPGRADFPTGALPPTDPSKCRFYGRGFERPADAHIVAVDDQNHLCTKPGSPGFHEIVLDTDSAILPLAKVYFK